MYTDRSYDFYFCFFFSFIRAFQAPFVIIYFALCFCWYACMSMCCQSICPSINTNKDTGWISFVSFCVMLSRNGLVTNSTKTERIRCIHFGVFLLKFYKCRNLKSKLLLSFSIFHFPIGSDLQKTLANFVIQIKYHNSANA